MREIPREAVVEAVKALCIEANRMLPADLKERLCGACRAAEALSIPVCQDTGMAVVFAELGEDAHVPGLEEAVNEAIREAKGPGAIPPFRGMSYNASAAQLVAMLNIGSISVKTE